jgi:hypothetical protein
MGWNDRYSAFGAAQLGLHQLARRIVSQTTLASTVEARMALLVNRVPRSFGRAYDTS